MIKSKPLALLIFLFGVCTAIYVGQGAGVHWVEQQYSYDIHKSDSGQLSYYFKGEQRDIPDLVPYDSSPLRQSNLDELQAAPKLSQQWVQKAEQVLLLRPAFHFGAWSLLPAVITIVLCLMTREPLTALLAGVIVGAMMLGRYDLTDKVLVPNLASESAAAILLLYLWLLGGLLGIWSKTGAALAFANFMTKHFVKGPRSAKLIAWFMGVLFFQGGTMSTVLVGTTVRPLADKAKVSHEEMSYIVDSTASPIASVITFNAWPAYVQALIFVPGVSFLATEADRISFFFSSVPFSFYGILAVLGTLLLSLNITHFSGKRIRAAHIRAARTGQLDAENAKPLSAKELQGADSPDYYNANIWEFLLPLASIIGIAIGTFYFLGSPKVNWAFAIALVLAAFMAMARGMALEDIIEGFGNGLKGVVAASVILMLAITIGSISKEVGGGLYLTQLLGEQVQFWMLPCFLMVLTMLIAFSTGTSWGTYAIAFPLAMPLAWSIAEMQHLADPYMFMTLCFAAVLNGSVYGDQCSPISDTTILSAMTTGCDLMDHVKSQLVPATFAAIAAMLLWTGCALVLV